jgi:hypothetical protein
LIISKIDIYIEHGGRNFFNGKKEYMTQALCNAYIMIVYLY